MATLLAPACDKPNIPIESGPEGLPRNTHGSPIVLHVTHPIRLVEVDDPC